MQRSLVPLCLGLLLAACSSAPVNFYTLNAVPPASVAPIRPGPTVQIGTLTVPETLDRIQIVRRGPGTAVAIDEANRWAAPLDDLARHALTQDLAIRLAGRAVMTTEETAPAGPVQVLSFAIGEFDGDAAGAVILQVHWTIFAGKPLVPARQGVEDIRLNGGGSAAELADTMSRALGQLADRLAAALP